MNLESSRKALKKYFGYESFRPMQEEIIQSVFDKKDTLVLMPTGGGKSICFQIPAIVLDGICVVISPLISLMKDQVDSLNSNGIFSAFLNSSLGNDEQFQIETLAIAGKMNLLYVSPEKLLSPGFLTFLNKLKINLFAIDEAHCISSWGHDFRAEYTNLKFLKDNFPDIPVMALTATADKLTRKDIIEQLRLDEPEIFISSFDRPNISLSVLPGQNRVKTIINFIMSRRGQSGIIYCLSRKNTETVCQKLREIGINADYYHAGLSSEKRNSVQEKFINDEIQVICATIAFGMGIDKSNVRWVVHYNLPKNIEGYYQEIGRAGRDSLPSEALLFYTFADIVTLKNIIEESSQKELQTVKLERMQQYADSMICRRKILLNYFGENITENCNNCDICKNPPVNIDGTVIVQKALSALWWLKKENKKVSSGILIDILKGSSKQEIFANDYQNIKTYGAGKDISFSDWQIYLIQILNLGFIDVAYEDNFTLRLTNLSKEVLYNNLSVNLIDPQNIRKNTEESIKKQPSKQQLISDNLFEALRAVRKGLAERENLPPYMIFSDATLTEMAKEKPITEIHLKRISGVGEKKFQMYGETFINAILDFLKVQNLDNVKNSTYIQTFDAYQQGLSIAEIAEKRALSESTIYSHLLYLYENKYNIDVYQFVNLKEMNRVFNAIKVLGNEYKLKDIYTHLNEELDYHKIKFALSHYQLKK